MTNRQIRTQAWALFRAHYRKMLPAVAIVQLFNFLPSLINMLFPAIAAGALSVSQLVAILVAPIAQCGAAAYALDILDGAAPKTGRLFAHAGEPRKIWRIWLAAAVYYCPTMVGTLVTYFALYGFGEAYGIALFALGLTSVVVVWLAQRLGLYAYAMARDPEARPSGWLRASWRAMRKNCWRLIRLEISLYGPVILLVIGILLGSVITGRSGGSAGGANPASAPGYILSRAVLNALLCFYMGYPMLATAGFADSLFAPERKQRR